MTAHWIEVKDGKWKMRAAVIGFKALSGGHSGENLGRYSVGLLDRIGIMDKNRTKVCQLTIVPAKIITPAEIIAKSRFLITFIQQR